MTATPTGPGRPLSAVRNRRRPGRPPHRPAESSAAIAVLGITGTGFAHVLNHQFIASEGATVASTVSYLLPVVAIVLGVLVLSGSVTVAMLAGTFLVLAGVALTRRRA